MTDRIVSFIRKLNRVASKPRTMALAPVNLPEGWLSDFVSEVPLLVEEVRNLNKMDSDTNIVAMHRLPSWIVDLTVGDPGACGYFFRPDCVVSEEGIKILEFNIDFGSAAIETGTELVKFFNLAYSNSFSDLFPGPEVLGDYFRDKLNPGQHVTVWDIRERSSSQIADRNHFVSELQEQGLSVRVSEGEQVLDVTEDCVFRFFAYPHFILNPDLRSVLRKLIDQSNLPGDYQIHSAFYDSKLNLARLWSLSESIRSPLCELIQKYLPPTYHLTPECRVLTEVLGSPEDWVLKRFSSFQGRAVYVGRIMDTQEWKRRIEDAIQSGDWIVQRFVPHKKLNMEVSNGRDVWMASGPHILNGFFFGGRFGGFVLRQNLDSIEGKVGPVDGEKVCGNLINFIHQSTGPSADKN